MLNHNEPWRDTVVRAAGKIWISRHMTGLRSCRLTKIWSQKGVVLALPRLWDKQIKRLTTCMYMNAHLYVPRPFVRCFRSLCYHCYWANLTFSSVFWFEVWTCLRFIILIGDSFPMTFRVTFVIYRICKWTAYWVVYFEKDHRRRQLEQLIRTSQNSLVRSSKTTSACSSVTRKRVCSDLDLDTSTSISCSSWVGCLRMT